MGLRMVMDGTSAPVSNADLHRLLVDRIVGRRAGLGVPVSAGVEEALRTVPRHLFVPGVCAGEAYTDDAVVTKRGPDGLAMSSVSQPTIIAVMLDQLEVRPGDRVLEIGSGGYNAALLQELVGADGLVVTMDIDPDVIDRARVTLAAAGYDRVRVLCGDGEFGVAGLAPFDRIIVTVEAADIPPAWIGQLTPQGRLVVPLRLRGLTRSLALDRVGDRLVSRGHEICGFVSMRGVGEEQQRQVLLHDEHGCQVALRVDNPQLSIGGDLRGALSTSRHEEWTGVTVGPREPFDDQDLWLAGALPEFCLLTATEEAVARRLVDPTWRLGTPAIASRGTVAYRTIRPVEGEDDRYEFGVHGHGPHAAALTTRMAGQIRIWDRVHRHGPGPVIEVHPAGTSDGDPSGDLVIEKPHTRVSVSWS